MLMSGIARMGLMLAGVGIGVVLTGCVAGAIAPDAVEPVEVVETVEIAPSEIAPLETVAPVEAAPVEVELVEAPAAPVESPAPVESVPAEEPVEAAPVEIAPAEIAPVEASRPADGEPAAGPVATFDAGVLFCGTGAGVAIDVDAHGNAWAYCEPALAE